MSRTDELMQAEHRLRDLAPGWSAAGASTPLETFDDETLVSELAYAQMQLERHLAETNPGEREREQSKLEVAMPAFTVLRLRYAASSTASARRDAEPGGARSLDR